MEYTALGLRDSTLYKYLVRYEVEVFSTVKILILLLSVMVLRELKFGYGL
jgi:hypothetical protein